jgi:hypothetical protein
MQFHLPQFFQDFFDVRKQTDPLTPTTFWWCSPRYVTLYSASNFASIWFHHGSESASTPSRSKIIADSMEFCGTRQTEKCNGQPYRLQFPRARHACHYKQKTAASANGYSRATLQTLQQLSEIVVEAGFGTVVARVRQAHVTSAVDHHQRGKSGQTECVHRSLFGIKCDRQ